MKNAKNGLVAGLIFLLAACGGPNTNTPEGRKARLEELRLEQSRIATEIASLERATANDGKEEQAASSKPKTVAVATVQPTTFKHFVEVQGQVESDNVVTVNGKAPGMIEAVLVREGDRVAKGQVLARIDAAITRSSIAEVETQLSAAEDFFNRQKALWDQKIGSEVQYIQAKTNYDAAKRRLATLREQLAMSTITAPIAGTIDAVSARVGEPSQNPMTGLFRIVNLTDLKVSGNVAEAYLSYLKRGDAIEIDFPELKKSLPGTLSFVSSVVDATSRTIRVEANVQAIEGLRPNMLAKLRINDQTVPNALAVDQNVLINSDQGTLVYVAVEKDGKTVAEARKVETGLAYNGRIQIKSGLRSGDRIITTGYQDVTEGQAIAF